MNEYALAPVQQGMLFHWLRDKSSGTDVEQIVIELEESIDPTRMADAWQRTVDTFSVLRTVFRWEGPGSPVQSIAQNVVLPFIFEDWRDPIDGDRTRRLESYLKADRQAGFDLSIPPATRVALFQTAEATFCMVWTIQHILIDGRSFETVLNHVFATYEAGFSPPLEDREYSAYIDWIASHDSVDATEFWRHKLSGFSATTPLPAAPGDAAVGTWAEAETCLSESITKELRELADREAISLNTIVMGAWAYLLSRYSGETDIVFGATKTTRRGTIPDADSMLGLFLATIPVRLAVGGDLSVAMWLRAVRAEWQSLRGYEHLPLVDIKQASELPASASLFETLVVFENYRFGTRLHNQGGKWARRTVRLFEQTGYPLTLLAYADASLVLKIEYDGRRFGKDTITRLSGQLTRILNAWAADATSLLTHTPVVTCAEEERLLHDWNRTSAKFDQGGRSLAALFEEQVRYGPNRTAVTCGVETVTYAELNERSNMLAWELISHGVGPKRLVGICLERSVDLLVGLLAVVKTGGAYVPLDPSFPSARLEDMAEDAGLTVLLTQSSLEGRFRLEEPTIVCMIDVNRQGNEAANPNALSSRDDLAYIIYTSGTTGKPKGVEITRGAFLNFLQSMQDIFGVTDTDSLLAVTTISFDISGLELFLPLVCGATVHIASRETASNADALTALLRSTGATLLQATPTTWRMLLDAGWGGGALTALCGGEKMPSELAAALLATCKAVWNMYGPTETTVWSSVHKVLAAAEPIPIGKPISNTRMYVLDENYRLLPIGATGQLYIAGEGVAKGYHARPQLTLEKFVEEPFVADGRMYGTGDLARFRVDGTIECLGRIDHQVKMRGFRIELGEIETLLSRYPGVTHALVVAREDLAGDKRLVAYVVHVDKPFDPAAVRQYLKASLPDYMVPSAYVSMSELPLTANGKIDRKLLPAPGSDAVARAADTVLPRTYIEKQLSEIWEDVFSISPIGVEDDFFDLGGHSLLALKMVADIKRVFGASIALNAIFAFPTIAGLARQLQSAQKTVGPHTLVAIQASGSRPPIYWIPGGAALGLFRLRHIVTRLGPEQPVYGLGSSHPRTLDDVETVEERAANYLALIREVQAHGPYCIAGFCAGGRVAFEMAQRLLSEGETVSFLGLINCWFPNHPRGRIARLRSKLQRLRYTAKTAGIQGVGIVQVVASKVAERREAQQKKREFSTVRDLIAREGFLATDNAQNEALLQATIARFESYKPKPYAGRASLFISDDESLAGVTPDLDPRYAWRDVVAAHEIRLFPGGHEAVLDMPYARQFAETLRSAIETALKP